MARRASTRVASQPSQESNVPQAGTRDIRFKLSTGHRPAHYKLPTSFVILDKGTKKQRTARYVRGYNTYWKDEQPDDVVRTPIDFLDGDLLVTKDEVGMQEYMLAVLDALGDSCPFKIDDPEAESRAKNRVRKSSVQAQAMLYDKSETEEGKEALSIIARYHGIEVDAIDFESVVDALSSIAESDPDGFINSFDNPSVRMKSLVIQGVNAGLFLLDDDTVVKDASTSRVLCPVPIGKTHVDALTQFALSEEGKAVGEYIENNL